MVLQRNTRLDQMFSVVCIEGAVQGTKSIRISRQAFPPIVTEAANGDTGEEEATDTRVQGLSEIPADWPPLPGNASLQAEIRWCQSNRLIVVEERANGVFVVHLDRARTPVPSWAALGWL